MTGVGEHCITTYRRQRDYRLYTIKSPLASRDRLKTPIRKLNEKQA